MSISKDALQDSNNAWERVGTIAPGGTIFGLAISPIADYRRFLAATGCGIFVSDDEGKTWKQRLVGLSTPLLSTLAVASNGMLFAGSLGGELFGSFDMGESWERGIVPQETLSPVTALLASPTAAQDGTIFAATDGGGLLVTRSSGKQWEDSSFGLGEANVLALAAPTDWSKRETMFAATTEGVFISRNGGRAWRESELMLDDDLVDVLAVSPNFDQDATVYAGTEEGRLYLSEDGGRTWDLLQEEITVGPINCLWLAPDFGTSAHMLAAVGASIFASDDGGETWTQTAELNGAVLALTGDAQVVLAGTHNDGIWKSTDGGSTWVASSVDLAARGFAQLAATDDKLFALGPQEGLWMSDLQTGQWSQLVGLNESLPLTSFRAAADGTLFVTSQEDGILRSKDSGQNWEIVCAVPGLQAVAVTSDGRGWAGTSDGVLLTSWDAGATWKSVESPCEGQMVLGIVPSVTYEQDHTVLMGTTVSLASKRDPRVALWRSTNSGETWRQVTTQATTARWLAIAMPSDVEEDAAAQALLATGPFCLRPLRRAKDVWISTQVDPAGSNTLSIVALGEIDNDGVVFCATGNGIFRSIDGGRTWQSFSIGLDASSFVSIVATSENEEKTLYTMNLGGTLWKRKLA